MFEMKDKSPIIVYNSDTKQCAEFLLGLISELANNGWPVNAIVVDAKQFASYPPEQRNAKQRVLYIGEFSESKTTIKNILDWKFERFGTRYGWHGNKGVITFDAKAISVDEFNSLAEFAENELKDYNLNIREKVEKRGLKFSQGYSEWLSKLKGIKDVRFLIPTEMGAVFEMVRNMDKPDLKQMTEQRQRFAVTFFCYNHLFDFMGLKDDDNKE